MKNKKTILIVFIFIIGAVLCIGIANNLNDKTRSPLSKDQTLAIYIEDADGEYILSNDHKFPISDDYILDTDNSSCKNGGIISQDETTRKIKLKTSNADRCTVYFKKDKYISLPYGLKANKPSITNYTDGDTKEMYVFDHDELETTTEYNSDIYTHSATQVASWTSEERRDYRYIGNNPNNYITFNDETWRIIGVFTVETETGAKEQLIKIIRNDSIGSIPWDMKTSTNTNGANEWSTSSLYSLLNGDYLNTGISFDYTYTNTSNAEKTITIAKGLSETAQDQIANVKWYLGGSKVEKNLGSSDYYAFERGETVYGGRTISIMQKIGLIYPSDYIYTYANGVDNTCYTAGSSCKTSGGGTPKAGWLYSSKVYWFQSPRASHSYIVFDADSTGYVYGSLSTSSIIGVRPTVYLKSEIRLTGGDGSQGNPYTIG